MREGLLLWKLVHVLNEYERHLKKSLLLLEAGPLLKRNMKDTYFQPSLGFTRWRFFKILVLNAVYSGLANKVVNTANKVVNTANKSVNTANKSVNTANKSVNTTNKV